MISRLRPIFPVVVLTIALVMLLAACRDDDDSATFAENEQAIITCSDECAVHGQCGALPDDQRAVLASEGGPAVRLHDRFFVDGTVVTVLEQNQRELIAARDGAPLIAEATRFPHMFYRVNSTDKTAWVSAWCLARP